MTGPILYTAEVDYGAEHLPAFSDWFANRHAPDLFKAGFRTAASYRATVGGLSVLNVYELPDTDLFKTPAYTEMSARDPYGAGVRSTSAAKPRAQTVYLQRAASPAGAGEANPPVEADWISMLRFTASANEDDALIDWLRNDAEQPLALLGAKCLRLAVRTADHVGAGTHRPRCLILIEWPARPPDDADLLPVLNRRFGDAITDAEPYIGYRVYPWPDRAGSVSTDL